MARAIDPVILDRREKRSARREKQREASVNRAKKMHIARIALQTESNSSASSDLQHQQNDPLRQFYIGCSGWFYWHWRGKFYPADMPNNQWFKHYAEHFDTVELNAPFYSWPTIATVKSWIRQAGKQPIVYTVKACELITHTKRFIGTKTLVKDFGYIADLLGEHMGCFLFQLPPSYHYSPARLKNIVSQLEPNRRNVVEFRHESWWNQNVYKTFRKNGIIFCSCSGPKLPDKLIKTADDIYVRFHGTNKWYQHDYTDDELATWAQRIKDSGAKRVWAYFNNDREGYAIKNANELAKQLIP
jgi:uncharacterized protein YecE (DUF72 family)